MFALLLDRGEQRVAVRFAVEQFQRDRQLGGVAVQQFGQRLANDLGCDACKQPLEAGDRVYMLMHLATPWKAEDDEDNDYSGYTWHRDRDEGSLAAG